MREIEIKSCLREKKMELNKIEGAIEALLFAMGESVELSTLAKTIGHDIETTRKIVRIYDAEISGRGPWN